MDPYVAVCQDCDWERPMPRRQMAVHAKVVHEDETGHPVVLERKR